MGIKYQRYEKEEPETYGETDGLLAFSLALHTILMVCSYSVIVANINSSVPMFVLCLFVVAVNFVFGEMVIRGMRKGIRKLTFPWNLTVLTEEINILILACIHINDSFSTLETWEFVSHKTGLIVIHSIASGLRYFLWLRIIMTSCRSDYQSF